MKNSVAVGLALLAFAMGALVAGAAAQSGPMAGWTPEQMFDFCRGMMARMAGS